MISLTLARVCWAAGGYYFHGFSPMVNAVYPLCGFFQYFMIAVSNYQSSLFPI